MTENELIEDIKKRSKAVKGWENKFSQLKALGMNKAEFCRRNDFHLSWLSKALIMNPLPKWYTIEKVSNAIEKELQQIRQNANSK